jgi:hypothetical protein
MVRALEGLCQIAAGKVLAAMHAVLPEGAPRYIEDLSFVRDVCLPSVLAVKIL